MPRDKNKGLHGDLGHVEPLYVWDYMDYALGKQPLEPKAFPTDLRYKSPSN
jgi:hypothetical protein